MGTWTAYENRMDVYGRTQREAYMKREKRILRDKLVNSLSYQPTAIVDGVPRDVVIVDSDNLNEKTMFSMPGEDFICGTIVEWANNYWLIAEKDANNELRTKVNLMQCNHLLKWIDDDGVIKEQWCVVEDGTKLVRRIDVYHRKFRIGLAYWKRCVKRIPLIAGTP